MIRPYTHKLPNIEAIQWDGKQETFLLILSKLPSIKPAYVNCLVLPLGSGFGLVEVGDYVITHPRVKILSATEFKENYE